MPFRMPPMPFPMPSLFITAVKDVRAINTFEKLLNILISEVYCWYFGFTTLLFSATITDMSLFESLNLFPRWPLVFRFLLLPPLVARYVLLPPVEVFALLRGYIPLTSVFIQWVILIPCVYLDEIDAIFMIVRRCV